VLFAPSKKAIPVHGNNQAMYSRTDG
jgi:hypothetical protein